MQAHVSLDLEDNLEVGVPVQIFLSHPVVNLLSYDSKTTKREQYD